MDRLNADGLVTRNRLTLGRSNVLAFTGNYNPDNPTALTTTGSVDSDVKNDRTSEFIVGLDHELAANVGVGLNYIAQVRSVRVERHAELRERALCPALVHAYRGAVPRARRAVRDCHGLRSDHPGSRRTSIRISRIAGVIQRSRIHSEQAVSNRWMASASFAFNDAVGRVGVGCGVRGSTCRAGGRP